MKKEHIIKMRELTFNNGPFSKKPGAPQSRQEMKKKFLYRKILVV